MRSNAASLMNWGTTRNWNGSRTSGVALNKSRSKLTDIIALRIDDEPRIAPWVRVGYSCVNMEQPLTRRKFGATANLSVVMPPLQAGHPVIPAGRLRQTGAKPNLWCLLDRPHTRTMTTDGMRRSHGACRGRALQ